MRFVPLINNFVNLERERESKRKLCFKRWCWCLKEIPIGTKTIKKFKDRETYLWVYKKFYDTKGDTRLEVTVYL